MGKIRKPITKRVEDLEIVDRRETASLTSPWLEEYQDCFTFQTKPVTQMFLERLSHDLIEWAKTNKRALRLSQFYIHKGIPKNTFFRWCDKYPILRGAKETAMSLMADRREIGAIVKKYEKTVILLNIHQYDSDWDATNKYHSDLKVDNEDKSHVFNITFNKPEITTPEELKLEVDKTKE